jgi:hypothetical protein
MNAKNVFAIVLLIAAFIFLIVIPSAIALNETRKEKRAQYTPYSKIGRVLDDLEYYLSVKYKIIILKNRLYTIRKTYLPELYRIEQEYLYGKYVEPIQRSIDFSKSFRTKEATIDFLTNETKPLFNAFETELIEMYNRNIELEKTEEAHKKAIDKAYDEELLKSIRV